MPAGTDRIGTVRRAAPRRPRSVAEAAARSRSRCPDRRAGRSRTTTPPALRTMRSCSRSMTPRAPSSSQARALNQRCARHRRSPPQRADCARSLAPHIRSLRDARFSSCATSSGRSVSLVHHDVGFERSDRGGQSFEVIDIADDRLGAERLEPPRPCSASGSSRHDVAQLENLASRNDRMWGEAAQSARCGGERRCPAHRCSEPRLGARRGPWRHTARARAHGPQRGRRGRPVRPAGPGTCYETELPPPPRIESARRRSGRCRSCRCPRAS